MSVEMGPNGPIINGLGLPWCAKLIGEPFSVVTRYYDDVNGWEEKIAGDYLPPASHFKLCNGQQITGEASSPFNNYYIPNLNGDSGGYDNDGFGGFLLVGKDSTAIVDNAGSVPSHSHSISGTMSANTDGSHFHNLTGIGLNPTGENPYLGNLVMGNGNNNRQATTSDGAHTHNMSGTSSASGGDAVIPKHGNVVYYIRIK